MKNVMADILKRHVPNLVPKFNLRHKNWLNLGRVSKFLNISTKCGLIWDFSLKTFII